MIDLLENELKATERENQLLKEQLISQEWYSRRDNLIFEGLKECSDETTDTVLKKFFCSVLGLQQKECQDLMISRCHRKIT